MAEQTCALLALRDDNSVDQAVVFLHGFSGNRDDTWATFPNLIDSEIHDWNIFTLGYATTLLPDIAGFWSADPDLTILADLFYTELSIPPLDRQKSIAVIAHSMGGLVAQKTLVDHPDLDGMGCKLTTDSKMRMLLRQLFVTAYMLSICFDLLHSQSGKSSQKSLTQI